MFLVAHLGEEDSDGTVNRRADPAHQVDGFTRAGDTILHLDAHPLDHLVGVHAEPPRDLFDVSDFIRATLTSKHKDKLCEAMVARRRPGNQTH